MNAPRTPKVNALVASLDARKDEETGRLDLIGLFATVQVPELPLELPGLTLFVSLTNLQGTYELGLEVIDLERDERLSGVDTHNTIEVHDPLRVWTEVARIPGPLTIEHAGRYACRLTANGQYLHEIVFEFELVESRE